MAIDEIDILNHEKQGYIPTESRLLYIMDKLVTIIQKELELVELNKISDIQYIINEKILLINELEFYDRNQSQCLEILASPKIRSLSTHLNELTYRHNKVFSKRKIINDLVLECAENELSQLDHNSVSYDTQGQHNNELYGRNGAIKPFSLDKIS